MSDGKLVERLREQAEHSKSFGTVEASEHMLEAADALEALQAENARLRKLLLPFADEAFTYDCDEDAERGTPLIPDEYFLRIEEGDGTLTDSIIRVSDLRKARAALSQEQPRG